MTRKRNVSYVHKKTRGESFWVGLILVTTPTSPQVRRVERYLRNRQKIRDIVKVQNDERRSGGEREG